jgi:hypothetical protein
MRRLVFTGILCLSVLLTQCAGPSPQVVPSVNSASPVATPETVSETDAGGAEVESEGKVEGQEWPECVKEDCNRGDFQTQKEAQAVLDGFPGDPHRLDGDKDGVACQGLF